MVPFVMRDIGVVRRQELLATAAYLELVKHLPASGTELPPANAWRKIAVAIRTFLLGQNSGLRDRDAVAMAGVRR